MHVGELVPSCKASSFLVAMLLIDTHIVNAGHVL
jgi:hypothetical protein